MSGQLPNNLLQLIQRGEPVIEGVPNRVFIELDENVRYLFNLLQQSSIGATIIAPSVTVEAGAVVGMPVFFNTVTHQFERAFSNVITDPTTGLLVIAPSAMIWGVVLRKINATLADLILYGYTSLDISAAVGGPVTAGNYYLSGITAGGLVKNKPPVAVPVLRADGNGNVIVMPTFVDFLDRHVHYHFQLTCLPAGSTVPPAPGGHHVITSPNPLTSGWLPANHASFNGNAPAGAKFGYNIPADPSLAAVWPPLPPSSSYLEWNRGEDMLKMGMGVPMGANRLCVIDRHGIWWMSDCQGDAPWPEMLDTSISSSASISLDACPYVPFMTMQLWFTRVNFATDVTSVTSLRTSDPRLRITCYGTGTAAATGDLNIELLLNFQIDQTNTPGYVAFKSLNAKGLFELGPIVEGIYSLSPNVILVGSTQRPVDLTNPAGLKAQQGLVGVSVIAQPTFELPVALVRLDGVLEELFLDLMYLGLPAGTASDYRARIRVPADTALPSPQLSLRFTVLGRAVGALPQLTITARRVPRPPLGNALQLPDLTHEFAVTCPTTFTITVANQYVEFTSTPFAVAAGDDVFFTVSRGSSDGYVGEVGLLEQVGVLSNSS